jgi:hypothetical protein
MNIERDCSGANASVSRCLRAVDAIVREQPIQLSFSLQAAETQALAAIGRPKIEKW